MTSDLKELVLTGAMATISARTIKEHHGHAWPGDKAVYQAIVDACDYLRSTGENSQAIEHACSIISSAKVQVVAEAWGAEFMVDQAWSQSELQRLRDLPSEAPK